MRAIPVLPRGARLNGVDCSYVIIIFIYRWRVWRCAERRFRNASYDVLELPGVVEWKKLFIERHNCEKRVRNLLDEAATSYVFLGKNNGLIDDSRMLCVKSLLNEHDYIMETLREVGACPRCDFFRMNKFYGVEVCLSRSLTVQASS